MRSLAVLLSLCRALSLATCTHAHIHSATLSVSICVPLSDTHLSWLCCRQSRLGEYWVRYLFPSSLFILYFWNNRQCSVLQHLSLTHTFTGTPVASLTSSRARTCHPLRHFNKHLRSHERTQACTHAHTHTRTHARMHARTHAQSQSRSHSTLCVCLYVKQIDVCLYVCLSEHIWVCVFAHSDVRLDVGNKNQNYEGVRNMT